MKIKRRDFLKAAGSGLLLASAPQPVTAYTRKRDLPPEAVGILYDATICVGCQVCVHACKQANNMPVEHFGNQHTWDNPRDLSADTLNVIKLYRNGNQAEKNREENGYSYIKRHCMHCIEPACVSACPVSALRKNPKTGVVSYNKDACIGCRYCMIACPFNIPKFEWDSATPQIRKCQLCEHLLAKGDYSACCRNCPTGASLFGPVEDLMQEAKRRLDMTPGQYYDFPVGATFSGERRQHRAARYLDHVYGAEEVGGTQVLMLAGVDFTRLGLPDLPEESYVRLADGIQYAIYKGMVYPLVVLGGLIYMVRKRDNHQDEPPEE